MTRRAITSIEFPDVAPGAPPTAQPETTWIAPTELLVDEAYQRDLSPNSLKLIRRIVEGWDWRKFKPPVVAWTEDGLEVIDGQHSAIAAATHPAIEKIPVVVVEAASQTDRAQAFIGHNKDRVAITAAQMHVAAAAAGDDDALLVNRVCEAAGVTLLRLPPARAEYPPRSTIALAAVRGLAVGEEEPDAVWVLRTLADAEFAPITAAHIRALTNLITDDDFAPIDRDALAALVRANPIKLVEREAKEHAATHAVPLWRGLVAVWFKALKKQPARRKAEAPPDPVVAATRQARTLDDLKRDQRPGRGRWKPGNTIRRCHACDGRFVGDGQAFDCADCAYGTASSGERAA